MKRLLFLSVVCVILFSVIVIAKCDDGFCDPNEKCNTCRADCLCEDDDCCAKSDCVECDTSYCESGECKTKTMSYVLEDAKCDNEGIISFKLNVHNPLGGGWGRGRIYFKDVFIYLKENNEKESFYEIKGKWYDNNKEITQEDYNVEDKKIIFKSEKVLDKNGEYLVRFKSKIGFRGSIFTEETVKCIGIKQEEPIKEIPKEQTEEEPKPAPIEPEIQKQEETIIGGLPVEREWFFKRAIGYIIQLFS